MGAPVQTRTVGGPRVMEGSLAKTCLQCLVDALRIGGASPPGRSLRVVGEGMVVVWCVLALHLVGGRT